MKTRKKGIQTMAESKVHALEEGFVLINKNLYNRQIQLGNARTHTHSINPTGISGNRHL